MKNNENKFEIQFAGISEIKEMIIKMHAEISELKLIISNQTKNAKKIKRSVVAEELGITWGQVKSISYCITDGEKKDGKKILSCIRAGKNFIYSPEEVEQIKEKLFNH